MRMISLRLWRLALLCQSSWNGARPLCAAHVGKLVADQVNKNSIDKTIEPYGRTMDEIFVLASKAKRLFCSDGREVPPGALGVYSYYQRLSQGLQQLMCGSRKFGLKHLTRDDVVTLTREAAEVTGLKYIMDADSEIAEQILMGKERSTDKTDVKTKSKTSSKPSAKAKQKTKK